MSGVKTNGAELKAFWNDESVWPENSYVDGVYLKVNGADADSESISSLNDADEVVLVDGYFCDEDDEGENLTTVFRRWRKKQNTVRVLVECPKERMDELKDALKVFGVKVIS